MSEVSWKDYVDRIFDETRKYVDRVFEEKARHYDRIFEEKDRQIAQALAALKDTHAQEKNRMALMIALLSLVASAINMFFIFAWHKP